MMCYKDRIFCPFYNECVNGSKCDRALTLEVHEKAIKWWGNEHAPISVYTDKPECFEIKNKEDEK